MKKNFTQKGQAKLLSNILKREEYLCCVPNPIPGPGGSGSDFVLHILDTATLDLSGNGNLSTPLFGNVKVSVRPNNILTTQTDGLYVGAPDFSFFARNGVNILTGKVELGGPLIHDTDINQSGRDLNFYNGNVGFKTQASPSATITIGDDIIGTPRLFLSAPDGTTALIETSPFAALVLNANDGIYLRPNQWVGAGSIVINDFDTQYLEVLFLSGGANTLARWAIENTTPGVERTFLISTSDGSTLLPTHLRFQPHAGAKLQFANIPQDDAAVRVMAMDVNDNVFYIDSSVLGGGSGTSINTATLSGTGAATTFNIAHGLAGTPKAVVTAGSADAAGISYITTNGTNIIIHYTVAPANGSNNLTIYWQANL